MPTIQFRVSEEELNQIKEAAKDSTVSEYIRTTALSAVKDDAIKDFALFVKTYLPEMEIRLSGAQEQVLRKILAEAPPIGQRIPGHQFQGPTAGGRGLRGGTSFSDLQERTDAAESRGEIFNPYEGWTVQPAPDGSTSGYYSDDAQCYVKVITNGKREQLLRSDNPLYALF